MPSGSCYCGRIQISFDEESIVAQGLCHCWDCRKLTGSAFTTNAIVKSDTFKVTGTPKKVHKVADSGTEMDNYFCGDCGCPLWGYGSFGDNRVVRMGIMDGPALENAKPSVECFSERRLTWIPAVEGAAGLIGMGNVQEGKA